MGRTPNSRRKSFIRLLEEYYLPHWRTFLLSSAFAFLTAAAASSYGLLVREIVDTLDSATQAVQPDSNPIWIFIGLLVMAVMLRSGALYAMEMISNTGVQNALVDIQNAQFQALNHGDYKRLARDNSGEWVSRFVNDVIAMRDAGLRVANDFSRGVLTVLGCFILMMIIDWKLTSSIFVVYAIAVAPVLQIGNRIRKRAKSAQAQMGDLTALLSEAFRSSRIVRAFGLEKYQDARADAGFRERSRLYLKVLSDRAAIDPILEVVGGIALALLLALTAWRISIGDTTLGNFVGIVTLIAVASPSIRALGTLNATVQEAGAAADRFYAVMDTPQKITSPARPKAKFSASGEIEFEKVHFAYDKNNPVLKGLSFSVKAGETVALVGPSGAGKSTVFNLLLRLYDPQSGRVKLDGVSLKRLNLNRVRGSMALVSQEPILFDDTVAANIRLGRQNVDLSSIQQAAEMARAHAFIENMLDGYDTRVGEMGSVLSGGQRQRVSLARAFLRDAPILLLDEATSALDAKSEAQIQSALDSFSKNRTTLIIAHRLATIRQVDRILVLEDGQLVENGCFDTLLEQGGLFAKLAKLQFA